MAKTVKMCDMNKVIAAKVFEMLNGSEVRLVKKRSWFNVELITDIEPKYLTYPEGWYYAKGCFRNKHMSTSGIYEEIPMLKSNGDSWKKDALYCTLYLDD